MTRPKVAVVTVVRNRLAHLSNVQRGLCECSRDEAGDLCWTVVVIDDPKIEAWRPSSGIQPKIVSMHADSPHLPIGRARNLGARVALGGGADVLVFLDVDCIPSPGLVDAYVDASRHCAEALLCGPVSYLPPAPPRGYELTELDRLAEPHPARPAPPPGVILRGGEHRLFWSLSFAVTSTVWRRLGGFHDGYEGYGAEDTDFGRKAEMLGIDLAWVGGARAYHQHHPVSDPPVEHLEDILRNGALYARRWGTWPMGGWLNAFEQRGLICPSPEGWTIC